MLCRHLKFSLACALYVGLGLELDIVLLHLGSIGLVAKSYVVLLDLQVRVPRFDIYCYVSVKTPPIHVSESNSCSVSLIRSSISSIWEK